VTVDDYRLASGPHRRPGTGRCAMEWVAHLAGEPHSDAPRTVSPVLAAFARTLNDALDDDTRQRLRPYLGRTIGTAGDGGDAERVALCLGWLERECAPALLAHAGLAPGDDAARARTAARRSEPGFADGARHAARAAARTAGWDAALAAVRAGDGDEARALAAWHTARDASWVAAWRDGPSPWPALRPVAVALQRSIFALFDRLLLAGQQTTIRWNGSSVGSAGEASLNVRTTTLALSGAEVPPLATLTLARAFVTSPVSDRVVCSVAE
jgi:hypothetical protein